MFFLGTVLLWPVAFKSLFEENELIPEIQILEILFLKSIRQNDIDKTTGDEALHVDNDPGRVED